MKRFQGVNNSGQSLEVDFSHPLKRHGKSFLLDDDKSFLFKTCWFINQDIKNGGLRTSRGNDTKAFCSVPTSGTSCHTRRAQAWRDSLRPTVEELAQLDGADFPSGGVVEGHMSKPKEYLYNKKVPIFLPQKW